MKRKRNYPAAFMAMVAIALIVVTFLNGERTARQDVGDALLIFGVVCIAFVTIRSDRRNRR
ncbi:MAG: hypothetical protein LBC65_00690 [Oscillospiraceae bacterium]|jgi:drug/metabolite transporter (DMT)-like permease|nr:hypothetical protein [Oscillospiraceae bacterium]